MKPLKQLVQSWIIKPPKFWKNLAGRSSPSQRDIIAWPMQQRFAHRRNYQKSLNDRGKITSCGVYSTSFAKSSALVSKIYDVLSLCPPWKLIEEYCFLTSNMLQLGISSASLNLFFSETLHVNLPVVRPKKQKTWNQFSLTASLDTTMAFIRLLPGYHVLQERLNKSQFNLANMWDERERNTVSKEGVILPYRKKVF